MRNPSSELPVSQCDVVLLETPFFPDDASADARDYQESKYSLAVIALGTYLRAHSPYRLRVLSMVKDRLTIEQVIRFLEVSGARVLGVPSYSFTFGLCYRFLRRIKEALPGLQVCVGGPHAALYPRETVMLEHIDSVVLGDGERPFLELCRQVVEHGRLREPLPPGVHTADSMRSGRPLLPHKHENLGDLPIPDLHVLGDYGRYRDFFSNRTLGILTTSRGCPFACHYCSSGSSEYRPFPIEHTIGAMRRYRDMGVQYIEFWDETFNPNKKRIREFAKALADANLGIAWSIRGAVVQHVDVDTMRTLREHGLRMIQFGVETSDPQLLRFLNKKVDRERIAAAFDTCHRVGLRTVANMIIGIPGQTRAQIDEDFRFLRNIAPTYVSINHYNWAPGTVHYRRAVDAGQIPDHWRKFAERPDVDFPRFFPEGSTLSQAELQQLRNRFVMRHYFAPSSLARYARTMDAAEMKHAAVISTKMIASLARTLTLPIRPTFQ